jgi:serine/threonine-protein kinase
LLLILLVSIAVPVLRYATDPERRIERIERRLADGEAQTLVAENGRPVWWRWRCGQEAAQVAAAPDGTFRVVSWTVCLLELVRDPQLSHYRIRADVRHEKSKVPGEVGLYFGLQECATDEGSLLSYGQLSFNDIDDTEQEARARLADLPVPLPPRQGNPVVLCRRFYGPRPGGAPWDQRLGTRAPRLCHPAGHMGGGWRTLTVEVSPERVQAYWGDEPAGRVGEIPAQEWAEHLNGGASGAPPIPPVPSPQFSPRGGIGLYVENGSASFRRVVVGPLGEGGRSYSGGSQR